MKNAHTQSSPATLTHNAQARILQKHILAFIKAQMKATEALEAINAIALCESEGNPLPCALVGTGSVLSYARNGHREFNLYSDVRHLLGYHPITESEVEAFDFLLSRSKQVNDASSHWASND